MRQADSKTTTRRAVLAGAAIMPALAIPSIAGGPASSASPGGDRALLDLDSELKAAHARMRAAMTLCSEANDRYNAMNPPKFEDPQPPADQADLYSRIKAGEMDLLTTTQPDHPLVVWHRQTYDQREAARLQHRELTDRLLSESGSDDAEAKFDDCNAEVLDVFDEIVATPANSITGLLVKVNAVALAGLDDDPQEAWDSIVADIRALASAPAVQS